MRIVNLVLAAMLALFAALQANDPDGLYWGALYGAGAVWTAIAATRPRALAGAPARALLIATVAAVAVLTAVHWPRTPGWWRVAVWWETETAREGMGLMILLAALLAPLATARAARRR